MEGSHSRRERVERAEALRGKEGFLQEGRGKGGGRGRGC